MPQLVTINGRLKIKDDEPWPKDHEYGYMHVHSAVCLPAGGRSSIVDQKKCVGGEVRLEVDLDAIILPDCSVKVAGTSKLYEGSSCNTNDLEDRDGHSVIVRPGTSEHIQVRLKNRGAGGGDWARGSLEVCNETV